MSHPRVMRLQKQATQTVCVPNAQRLWCPVKSVPGLPRKCAGVICNYFTVFLFGALYLTLVALETSFELQTIALPLELV